MKRLLFVLATIVALLLPNAAAAYAAAVPWNYAPCIEEQTMGGIHWDNQGRVLVLNGYAVECAPTVTDGGFRLAHYTASGTTGQSAGYNVRLFEGGAREFGAAVVPNGPGQYGICMLGAGDQRLLCRLATVTAVPDTSRLAATTVPLATDDPLVTKAVTMGTYNGGFSPPPRPHFPDGNCGTCF